MLQQDNEFRQQSVQNEGITVRATNDYRYKSFVASHKAIVTMDQLFDIESNLGLLHSRWRFG